MSAAVTLTLFGLCQEVLFRRARALGVTGATLDELVAGIFALPPTRKRGALSAAAWLLAHTHNADEAAAALMHVDDVFVRSVWIKRVKAEVGCEVSL